MDAGRGLKSRHVKRPRRGAADRGHRAALVGEARAVIGDESALTEREAADYSASRGLNAGA